MAIKILLVDDHPIVRKGIKMFIDAENGYEVCGEAGNANEAIKLLNAHDPDVVTVDLTLDGDTDGLELITNIKKRFPKIHTIVVSMHDESVYAERALRAGAKGYIMKKEGPEKIIDAIQRVLNNKIYVSEKILDNVLKKLAHKPDRKMENPTDILSNKEFVVFQLIGQGFRIKNIATKMKISKNTVSSYKNHIKEKLNLKNSHELYIYALNLYIQKDS